MLTKQILRKSTSSETDLKIENEKLRRRIKELESSVNRLSNNTIKKRSKYRILDFSQYAMRRIALKFCYLGWAYSGLAQQQTVDNTIVEKIIEALELCKLIEKRDECDIVVCGRTDKGVSAFQQVISLTVRSNLKTGKGIVENTGLNYNTRKQPANEEIDFVFILNKVLPKDIRMLSWSPVDLDFSARFNCIGRSYKYFFPRSDLCLESMQEAANKLIGEHDFRNFCSMQVNQGITKYIRKIYDVKIEPYDELEKDSIYKMYVVHIKASSFIYHQIRCMAAVLFMVGQKHESPDIVDQLLDINGLGGLGKPLYPLASDLPLVFYESKYNDIEWITSKEALNDYTVALQKLWVTHQTKQNILKLFLDEINDKHSTDIDKRQLIEAIITDMKPENWKPLMKRQRELTLEARIDLENVKRIKRCIE